MVQGSGHVASQYADASVAEPPHPLEVPRNTIDFSLHCRDVEYAYPKRSGLVSDRHSNPLDPQYNLGQEWNAPPQPAAEAPRRDTMALRDIEGTAPSAVYDRSRAPKSIMDWSDVEGSTVRPAHLGRTGKMRTEPLNDSLRVGDINYEGTFRSMRETNPLEPQYEYDARTLRPQELMGATGPFGSENGRERRAPVGPDKNLSLTAKDIEGAKPFSWNDIWDKLGNKALRTTNYIGDIEGSCPGGLLKKPGVPEGANPDDINLLGTLRMSNPIVPTYTQLDGTRPASRDHYTNPREPAFPFGQAPKQEPKPSRLPPMEGDVFPSMLPPPPEPLKVAELDERAKRRHEMRVMDGVRDKVEAKSKRMANVFRQFDENKDGDISYDEFRQGLAHLGVELSDDDYAMLVKKVDVDGEGTVDYNEFAEVLKAPDMQLSFMPTDAPFAGTADVSSMKTDMEVKRAGADGSASQARKQMGMAMLPKDDILRQISEKVESKSKNLRNVFRDFDEDKSGTVDVIEFRRGLAHLGFEMTNKQYDALLNRVDRDSDGDINYNEFAARLKGQDMQMGGIGGLGVQDWQAEAEAIREKTAAETSKEMGLGRGSAEVKLVEDIAAKVEGKSKYIRKVFRDFDEDFDGTVNHEEFKKGLEHLGVKLDDKKFNMLLKLVDQDESGSVDYLEFSNVLKGQDMQIGNQIGGTEDPKLAALRSQGGEPAPAPASSLPPPPGPAPAPAAMAAAPAAAAKAPTGPPKLPVGFKPPSSSGSYRSNSSSKKMSARAASRQSDIDSVRDLPM